PNPLGLSTTPIVMNGGVGVLVPRLFGSGATNITISRGLTITNPTPDSVGAIGDQAIATPTGTFTYNGAIAVNGGALRFEFHPSPAGVINGAISGTGRVTDAGGSAQVLNG